MPRWLLEAASAWIVAHATLVHGSVVSDARNVRPSRSSPPEPPLPGNWVLYEPMSDEFDGSGLNTTKWMPYSPYWKGRQPGWFAPANVVVSGGAMQLHARAAHLNATQRKLGYDNYTTSMVESVESTRLGLFSVRFKSGSSLISSSWWFTTQGGKDPSGWANEIDVFESCGSPKLGYNQQLATHIHIWEHPASLNESTVESMCNCTYHQQDGKVPCSGGVTIKGAFEQPTDAAWHVATILWTDTGMTVWLDGKIRVMRTGKCLEAEARMLFDRETMPDWFGLPDPSTLPDQPFQVDYVRAWKAA